MKVTFSTAVVRQVHVSEAVTERVQKRLGPVRFTLTEPQVGVADIEMEVHVWTGFKDRLQIIHV